MKLNPDLLNGSNNWIDENIRDPRLSNFNTKMNLILKQVEIEIGSSVEKKFWSSTGLERAKLK